VRPAPKVGGQLPAVLLKLHTLLPGTSWSMLAHSDIAVALAYKKKVNIDIIKAPYD